jgi:hypothetical protein
MDDVVKMFPIGVRVEASEKFHEQFARSRTPRTGVVTGHSKKKPQSIYVLRDGSKTPSSWHHSFWQPVS